MASHTARGSLRTGFSGRQAPRKAKRREDVKRVEMWGGRESSSWVPAMAEGLPA